MPKAKFKRVRMAGELGDYEGYLVGEYVGKYFTQNFLTPEFQRYQSVMYNCRMVLTEKVNPDINVKTIRIRRGRALG